MPVSIPYTLLPGARAPTRATTGAAGMDLYAYLPGGAVLIDCGERHVIPTGLRIAIPAGYEGQVRPRSGLALNHGLTVLNSPGTVDSDYRGEVAAILFNHGHAPVTIRHGDRVAQLVIAPIADVALTEAATLPPTERGAGGFGSTGTGTGPAQDYTWEWFAQEAAEMLAPPGAEDIARAHLRASDLRDLRDILRDVLRDLQADRARLEARVRRLEAEVLEARAEAAKWAAELDALRAVPGGAQ